MGKWRRGCSCKSGVGFFSQQLLPPLTCNGGSSIRKRYGTSIVPLQTQLRRLVIKFSKMWLYQRHCELRPPQLWPWCAADLHHRVCLIYGVIFVLGVVDVTAQNKQHHGHCQRAVDRFVIVRFSCCIRFCKQAGALLSLVFFLSGIALCIGVIILAVAVDMDMVQLLLLLLLLL